MSIEFRKQQKQYSGSQEGVYAAGRLGWDNCNAAIADFAAVSGIYTPQLVADMLKEIDDAEALPAQGNRAGRRRSMRVGLKAAQVTCLANWQQLKGYAEKVWKGDLQAAKLAEAGLALYRSASGSKWRDTQKLLQQGADFMELNRAELTRDVMPPAFEKDYVKQMDTFTNLWKQYSAIAGTNAVESSVKRQANNSVYEKLISMLSDGKRIFTGAERNNYSYSNLLRQSGYGGSAGMRVVLTTGKSKLPVADAEAISSDGKYTGISNKDGVVIIRKMKEGEQTFTFNADGYEPLTVTIELKAGVVSKFEYTLLEEVAEMSMEVVKEDAIAA